MAYIQIGNNYPTSTQCTMILAGLSDGWAYGARTCKWYIKAGSTPTESNYDFMKTATITNNSATSGGNVAFGGLTPNTKYYCHCYVYCTTDEWIAVGGSTTEPIAIIFKFEDGTTAAFTTLAGNPSITSLSATQTSGGGKSAIVSWSGTNLAGGTYTVTANNYTKASGLMSSDSGSVTISFDNFQTYTITVSVTNNGATDSANTSVTLKDGGGEEIDLDRTIAAYQYPEGSKYFSIEITSYTPNNLIGCSYTIHIGTSSSAIDTLIASGIINDDNPNIAILDEYTIAIDNNSVPKSGVKYHLLLTLTRGNYKVTRTHSVQCTFDETGEPDPWSWSDIYAGVVVANISYTRWNAFCDRIIEWLEYKEMLNYIPITTDYGSAVSLQGLVTEAKMTSADKILTANRFNIVKMCIYQLNGGIAKDGFEEVDSGDPVLASYFTTLATDMNNIPV